MELFAPENRDLRPFLYIDLDSYVIGDPHKLMGGDRFRMVPDFLGVARANSCAMWVPKNCYKIWSTFAENPRMHMDEAGKRGDQYFLGKFVEDYFTDEITSYKKDCKDGPKGTIVQFHGKPKPHESTGWARRVWEGS